MPIVPSQNFQAFSSVSVNGSSNARTTLPCGGAYGAVAGIGASVGLVLAGVLTDWLSWRYGFFINVPIGAVMLLTALRYLSETNRAAGRFDLVGALTSTLGVSELVYGLVRSAEAGWGDSHRGCDATQALAVDEYNLGEIALVTGVVEVALVHLRSGGDAVRRDNPRSVLAMRILICLAAARVAARC